MSTIHIVASGLYPNSTLLYLMFISYTVRSIYALLFLETLIREVYGAKEIRTPDPQNANLVLYQLSYNPDTDGPEWT